MLLIGRQRQRTCSGWTRRAFLEVGAASALGLSLGHLRAAPGFTLPQRSVLLLWLWGGPSHLDSWDPKPGAPLEFRGPFSPIASRVVGVCVSELFPRTADRLDRVAILRSLRTGSNDHGVAGTIGLTGSNQGAVDLGGKQSAGTARPALGAVVAKACGRQSALPPFMVVGGKLHQGKKAIIGEGGGPLGTRYDPFRLEYDPAEGIKIPDLQLATGLTPERLQDRRQLVAAFDRLQRQTETLRRAGALDDHRAQAFDLLTAPATQRIFDLSREKPSLADRYGRSRFGQSCLLARRLIEHGVPFVQVNWSSHVEPEEDAGDGGWDNHYRNFQIMQDRQAPLFDQTWSALLDDLGERGLLTKTVVVAVGEFGRTPKINDKAGRDHWEHCYGALLAGGGVAAGRVVGSSTARGEEPNNTPCTPADLAATIQHLAGITSEQAATLGLRSDGHVIDPLLQ
jgi:hypothetical protein